MKKLDYKKVYRETGLIPKDFDRLQKLCHEDTRDKRTHPDQVTIFSCQCKSVWCNSCAKHSPTNKRIATEIQKFNWEILRHIVLTIDRKAAKTGGSDAKTALTSPKSTFLAIRRRRSLAKLMKALRCKRWLWILEFHADGYPHWHVLAEYGRYMIGKRKIQRLWKYGHVWESYIKDENHFKAISGYHGQKGYLAGENKKHQLVLPDYLLDEKTVRKYAKSAPMRDPVSVVPRETTKKPETRKKRAKSAKRSYKSRFALCDTETTICVNGSSWAKINLPLNETRDVFTDNLERLDYKTFNIPKSSKDDFFTFLSASKVHKKK